MYCLLTSPAVFPGIIAATGLLARATFGRLVSGLRHGAGGAFAVVLARLGHPAEPADAERLRAVVRPGDLVARWSPRELVLLRHPVAGDADADRLVAEARAALGDGAVVAARSSAAGDTPLEVLGSLGSAPGP